MKQNYENLKEVRLSGALNIRNVANIRAEVIGSCDDAAQAVINCTDISEVDLSGVQLLLALLRFAERRRPSVRVIAPRMGVLSDTLARAGLAEAFETLARGATVEPGAGVQ